MKFYTKMPSKLIPFFQEELTSYETNLKVANYQLSWFHLERAHIIGQKYPIEHSSVHWKMLLFGVKIKNTKEVLGQIPRLLLGGVKSFVGNVPVGNTGGANVPPLQPVVIPDDLIKIIKQNTV